MILCEDLELPEGRLREVYIGPSGIYVLSEPITDAENLYIALRKLFETSRFKLYIQDLGEYIPSSGGYSDYKDDEALSGYISEFVYCGSEYFNSEQRDKISTDLFSISNRERRIYKDSNGKSFIYKNGDLKEVSPHSSSVNYVLTLFGGVLGAHQFALHKYGTGLLYLLTGGGFLIGWLMDILFLFLGIQKDKKKRYLLPLEHKFCKLILLPLGIICGMFLFNLYIQAFKTAGESSALLLSEQVRMLNPNTFENLFNNLSYYADLFSK